MQNSLTLHYEKHEAEKNRADVQIAKFGFCPNHMDVPIGDVILCCILVNRRQCARCVEDHRVHLYVNPIVAADNEHIRAAADQVIQNCLNMISMMKKAKQHPDDDLMKILSVFNECLQDPEDVVIVARLELPKVLIYKIIGKGREVFDSIKREDAAGMKIPTVDKKKKLIGVTYAAFLMDALFGLTNHDVIVNQRERTSYHMLKRGVMSHLIVLRSAATDWYATTEARDCSMFNSA